MDDRGRRNPVGPRRTGRSATSILTAAGLVLASCAGGSGGTGTASIPVPTTGVSDSSIPNRHDVDGVLRLGVWLPTSGPAAALGTPLLAAVSMAVKQINADGGVNGRAVTVVPRDEGSDESTAYNSLNELLANDQVDAIIGPASSRIALGALDVIAQAKVVTCSPAASALELDDRRDDGYFVRTIGSDALEAVALGSAMTSTGDASFAVLYPDDDYGRAYFDRVKNFFSRIRVDVRAVPYDPTQTEFNGPAQTALDGGTQVIGVIGSEPVGARVLKALADNGAPPDRVPTFVTDGLRRQDLGRLIDPARPMASAGIQGVSPRAEPRDPSFARSFALSMPGTPLAYVAYAYDCVNLIALAAQAAGSDDPEKIHNQLTDVSNGGSPCQDFEACKTQLAAGRNIDLNGTSGNLDLLDNGDVSVADYEQFVFDNNGNDVPVRTITVGSSSTPDS
jgi:branched-chain amino acid transport system substrate-binding protein